MPGLFIDVKVDASIASDADIARKLADACPVDIFEASDTGVSICETNLDECSLCDLCLAAAPGKVTIVKLYDQE